MIIGIPKETFPNERRVALIPQDIPRLTKKGHQVYLEAGAGAAAGYPDPEYSAKGANLVSRQEVFERAQLIAQVRLLGANPEAGREDLARLGSHHTLLGFMNPLGEPALARELAETKATALAVELVPRITRAQAMDALSSMANLAGYRSVLIAATHLSRVLPMMMTAAGTLSPAKFFVLGAGVAGLQAIATARRLGAVVEAYDVRPEVKDQVVSVGGKFVELNLDTASAGDTGGYAKAQSQDFYRKQQELLAPILRQSDAVITTAAVPGRRIILVTKEMMEGMRPGSVIVDLAAETGGNCEVTRPGESVDHNGVQVLGPLNVPSDLAYHASQMYSRNVVTFLEHLINAEGQLTLDMEDEITAGSLVCRGGEVVHPRITTALAQGEN